MDALDYTPRWFRFAYEAGYLFLVRSIPWVWRMGYGLLDHPLVYGIIHPIRRRWNLWVARAFVSWLKALQPAVIVVTHFLPAHVCSSGKAAGWLRSALVVVVTDLYPHRLWISQEPEAVVVSTPEGERVLRQRGVAHERIHVLGIPVGHAFGTPMDQQVLRRRFELQPDRLTVLVTSGGTTVGRFEHVVRSLAKLETRLPRRLQLLVVCGGNDRAKRSLNRVAQTASMSMRIFGFVEYMAELMAVSDLVIAKAGGLTVSEALAEGLPLIFYHVIPGQERLNAQYVSQHGAGIIAQSPLEVAASLRELLEHPERLAAMRDAANTLRRPNAAEAIVSRVIAPWFHA